MPASPRERFIARTSLAFMAGAALWLFGIDRLLSHLADNGLISRLSTLSDLIFVALLAALLYRALHNVPNDVLPPAPSPINQPRRHSLRLFFRCNATAAYLLSAASSALMLALHARLNGLADHHPLLPILMLPTLFCGVQGGLGPGLLALLLSLGGAEVLGFLPPLGAPGTSPGELMVLGVFTANGVLISILGEAMHTGYEDADKHWWYLDRALKDLRERDRQLNFALDATGAGIWEWHADSGKTYWSDELWKLYGLPKDCVQPSLDTWLSTICADDRTRVAALAATAVIDASEFETEWRVQLPADAPTRWLWSRGHCIRKADGTTEGFAGIVLDITSSKSADAALKASEDTYRSLFDHMLNGFAYCQILYEAGQPVDLLYLKTNDAFRTQTGLGDVTGRRLSEVIPGILEHDHPLIEQYAQIAATGQPQRFEVYVQALKEWFAVSAYSPKPEHVVAVFDVITPRKVAEEAIRRERMRWQAIMHTSSDGMHVLDRTGLLIDANPAFLRMIGRDESAIGRLRIPDWDGAMTAEEIQAQVGELIRRHGTHTFETHFQQPDGHVMQAEISACAIDVDGEPMIFAATRDVTERKHAQAELTQHRHHLEERVNERTQALQAANNVLAIQSAELADLYNNAPCGYHSINAEGVFVGMNDTELAWLGYTREEVIGHLKMTDVLAPHSQPVFTQNYQRFRASGHIENVELDFIRKNGTVLPALLHAKAIYGPDGIYLHSRTSVFDITERKRTDAQLRIAAVAFQSHDSMLVTDHRGIILQINAAFAESTGYSAEEVIGRTPAFLHSGRQDEAFYRTLREAIHREGFWQGAIWNRRKDGEIRSHWLTISAVRNEHDEITHFIGEYADISEPREAERRILELAYYDPLTNLPNRRLLHDRLRQAVAGSARSSQYGALLMLDLDHFKTINDTRGHQVGDRLLVEIAQRLRTSLRETDTAARQGGDEFLVLLDGLGLADLQAATTAETIADKLHHVLGQPYLIDGSQCHIGVSIGIALFSHPAANPDTLLKQADLAMYDAKGAGRNTTRFYNTALQEAINARAQLEAGLYRALEEDELTLHYQPQVDDAGLLFGVEALLRWQPPGQPIVSPAEFIPVAEESGLILPIGAWVLDTACRQIAAWAQSPATRHLQVAINISARQFRQHDFVEQVRHALACSGADPHCVKLELTESSLVDDVEDVVHKMQAIKQLGVSFSMDDFGTGYSSLAYLKRLPLGQLKIDQSFVRNIPHDADDCAIARAVIALGQSLHLNVIAEGVETEAQREYLANHGCIAYQGYLFGRPVAADDITALARESQPLDTYPQDQQR